MLFRSCLRNLGPHGLDMFLYLTGEEAEVTGAQLSRRAHERPVEDYASVMLRSESGILGTVEVGNGFPRDGTDGEWKIAGRDAILTMKDGITKLATAEGDVKKRVLAMKAEGTTDMAAGLRAGLVLADDEGRADLVGAVPMNRREMGLAARCPSAAHGADVRHAHALEAESIDQVTNPTARTFRAFAEQTIGMLVANKFVLRNVEFHLAVQIERDVRRVVSPGRAMLPRR